MLLIAELIDSRLDELRDSYFSLHISIEVSKLEHIAFMNYFLNKCT
uniref:Uncharacterized protein n=1 Tax=Rhizophora mucronata TaxID=61149 RepID=A0A2P2PHA7_RHIMU